MKPMRSCGTCSPCPWKLRRPRVDVSRTNQEPYPPKIQLLTWSTGKFLTIWAQTFTVLKRIQIGDYWSDLDLVEMKKVWFFIISDQHCQVVPCHQTMLAYHIQTFMTGQLIISFTFHCLGRGHFQKKKKRVWKLNFFLMLLKCFWGTSEGLWT